MDFEERLDYIEFRMNLLREGTDFAKFVYDSEITYEQLKELYIVMDEMRYAIDNGKEVSSSTYEHKILEIVDKRILDYHFCESFARLLWEDRRYEEVFPALYGNDYKFKHLFEDK